MRQKLVTGRLRAALFLLVLFVVSLLTVSNLQNVNGQFVGLVCIAPTSANACPPPVVTVSGSVGSQLMLPVLIQGSDIFSSFDITLVTHHTILVPAGVSLAGSLLSSGTVIVECVGAILKSGPRCTSTDTSDTLHLAVVGPLLGFAPVDGLLFTAVFNITSNQNTTIGYQTGCTQSSVNGTSTCVLLTNGSLANPYVITQPATYTPAPSPTFSMASSLSEISLGKAETANSTIAITSFNGFVGTVTFSTSFSPSTKHPPSFSMNPSSITVTSGGFATATFNVVTRTNTDKTAYNVTIVGSGGGLIASLNLPVTVLP